MSGLLSVIANHDMALPAIDPVTGPVLTAGELAADIRDRAGTLAARFERTRPVALHLDHGLAETLLELALAEAGVPVLSLPRFLTPAQVEHAIGTSGTQAHFTANAPDEPQACRSAPASLPQGTARITFTSGSTGTPKGVCVSLDHMLTVAAGVVEAVGAEHAGRHLALLPPGILLETVAGLYATVLAGGCYVCPPQAMIGLGDPFRPDFPAMVAAIDTLAITSLILVPEYLAGIIAVLEAQGRRLPRLTIVAVGGARTPPALLARARALGLPVRQGYGLTECASVVSLEGPNEASGSVGRLLPHLRMEIAADGEVVLFGPAHLGTIGEPRVPGPLHTGDLGRLDDQRRLWIEGRKSSLIITSFGRNVSPEWVEEALLARPEIAQAMVWGDGQPAPRALLVPAYPEADLAAAVAAVNEALPHYAQVAEWREVSHFLPGNCLLTGNGRLRRKAIAARWLDGEPAFFHELEAATVRQRLGFLAIPQLQAGLSGAIGRATYLAYLEQAYHHVRHTVPLLQAARAKLAHRPDLARALDAYIVEETGHEEWILNDIAAAGGNAARVRASDPAPATRAMVDHAYDRIANGNAVSFFGMVFVLESVSVALAQRGAKAVAERLGLPPEAFTYLTSHGELDQDHMEFFARLVNRLTDPADRAAIVEMARAMFGLYGAVFASIELESVDVAA